MLHEQLMYSNTRPVIYSAERQNAIVIDIPDKGLEHDPKTKVMALHRGRNSMIQKISNRFSTDIKGEVE